LKNGGSHNLQETPLLI